MGRRGPRGIDPEFLLDTNSYWQDFFERMRRDEPELYKRLTKIKSARQLLHTAE